MEERERLIVAVERVSRFDGFDVSQRGWWWDLRQAAEHFLRRCAKGEHPDLEAAFDAVSVAPEHAPDEPRRWLHLLEAAERALQGDG